jgi:predicted Zn-dependent protease with MMP-like domain
MDKRRIIKRPEVRMKRERFEELVSQAVAELPDELRNRMENIDLVVQNWPTPGQLARVSLKNDASLLRLYQGVPQTQRTAGYSMVLPDKITIFHKSIEACCRGDEEVKKEVRRVVLHEIAHHFGIGDKRLRELGM